MKVYIYNLIYEFPKVSNFNFYDIIIICLNLEIIDNIDIDIFVTLRHELF
jgi:hypothetical protein